MAGPNYAAIKPTGSDDQVQIQEAIDTIDQETPRTAAKHTGGGWYELSDGTKIKGKDEAAAAQAKL